MVLRRRGAENLTNLQQGGAAASMIHFRENEANSSEEPRSPLGLTLRKTPSFLNLIETRLSEATQRTDNHFMSTAEKEKLKASNFPASVLKIGTWERISRYEGDLIAKLYYAKRKLVWEVLEGALKSKIEVQWSEIVGIRALIHENDPGILEIELNQPPLFFRETNPQPRKHTLWQQASDFTGGQAPLCRMHTVVFPPGTLEKHYEKLLQCDQRLFALSQKPFPTHNHPFFLAANMYGFQDFPIHFNNGCPLYSGAQLNYPTQNFYPPQVNFMETSGQHLIRTMNTNSPMSDESGSNAYDNHGTLVWGNPGENSNLQGLFSLSTTTQVNPTLPCQDHCMNYADESSMDYSSSGLQLDDIDNHLLGDTQIVCPDELSVFARVSSMSSLLLPPQGANPVQVFSQPVSWSSAQASDANLFTNLPPNMASYEYPFTAPTVEEIAALDASQDIHPWT